MYDVLWPLGRPEAQGPAPREPKNSSMGEYRGPNSIIPATVPTWVLRADPPSPRSNYSYYEEPYLEVMGSYKSGYK